MIVDLFYCDVVNAFEIYYTLFEMAILIVFEFGKSSITSVTLPFSKLTRYTNPHVASMPLQNPQHHRGQGNQVSEGTLEGRGPEQGADEAIAGGPTGVARLRRAGLEQQEPGRGGRPRSGMEGGELHGALATKGLPN